MSMPSIPESRACRARIVIWLALTCASPLPVAKSAAGEISSVSAAPPVELRLPDLDGRELGLNELRGKVVLVNFWASWCTPCLEEMPSIQRLAERMSGRPFAVIGVNVAESGLRVGAMVERMGIRFPVLLDPDSAVFDEWGATVLPTTYVLDGEGRVRYVGRGPLEWDADEINDLLTGLMEAGSKPQPQEGPAAQAR